MTWTGPRPARRHEASGGGTRTRGGLSRPVVAVLDTGTGAHPWLGDEVVVRDPEVLGEPIGLYPPGATDLTDTETGGMSVNPLTGGLDPAAGHGTFIAGLVFQGCPDAVILSCRSTAARGSSRSGTCCGPCAGCCSSMCSGCWDGPTTTRSTC